MILFLLLAGAGPGDSRRLLDEFEGRMRKAKTVQEKEAAIRELGGSAPKDDAVAAALARYMMPGAGDINYIVVAAAADGLGTFRGNSAASRALLAVLPAYRKLPYVAARLREAVVRVGHESGLAAFDEALQGGDPDAAAAAIRAIAAFPAATAVDALFRECEKRKGAAPDDRVLAEIVKALQTVSGERYPTLPELQLWWKKRGEAFRAEAERREKAAPPPQLRPAAPVLLVELLFREGMGTSTLNSGASAGLFPQAQISSSRPAWTPTAPPWGGPSALEWDKSPGPHAVDLGGGRCFENLKSLKSFTISGWMMVSAGREGPGGNRVVTWLSPSKSPEGVELVWRSDGSLQLGVNQPAEASPARTPAGRVPVRDPKSADPSPYWRFFAVTYDSTSAKFFLGSGQADAELAAAVTLDRGPAGAKISPVLSVGHVPPPLRSAMPDRAFRGILDQIRVHGSALEREDIVRVQNRLGP